MKRDVEACTFVDKSTLRDETDHGSNVLRLILKCDPHEKFRIGVLTIAKRLNGTQRSTWRVGQHQPKSG